MKVLARFKINKPGQTSYYKKLIAQHHRKKRTLFFFKPQTCIASDFIEFKDLIFILLFLRQTLWRTFIISSMEEHFRHKVNYRLLYTVVDETLTK